jgi:tRNA-specific 2-thiouridylase
MEMMKLKGHVFVALSGGVDSAVCAALLLSQGYQVTGIHMDTWKETLLADEKLGSGSSKEYAEKTAKVLQIPFISMDVKGQFYRDVVLKFIEGYLQGSTPNPCLFCNPTIKWGILQSYALEKGADYFATGHYAKLVRDTFGNVRLLRGADKSKDQSYVLSLLSQFQLQKTLMPLGSKLKSEVRSFAQRLKLPVADREESQDLCFLGVTDYRDFLQRYSKMPFEPGEIVNINDEVVGQHRGLPFYTIGQRKGIRVASSEPYYVIEKDISRNRLVVGFADEAGQDHLIAGSSNWISGQQPNCGQTYDVMIRYRANPVEAILTDSTSDKFRLKFIQPQRGITPGQVASLYSGEECLGGGVILSNN